MVRVIPAEEEHKRRRRCSSCRSLLEYCHDDTDHRVHYDPILMLDIHKSYILCPVCGHEIKVNEWAVDCL